MVAALVAVAEASPAVRQDGGTAKAKRSQVALRLPKAGHISIKVLHLRVTGKAVARAPKKITLKFGGTAAGRRGRLLAAVHTSRKKTRVDYTFLFVVLNPVKKTIASASADPVPATYISDEDFGRFVTFLFTGIDPGEVEHVHDFQLDFFIPHRSGKLQCTKCGEFEAAGLTNADTSAQRTTLGDAIHDLGAPIDFSNASTISNIDTGHYDDGHAFGWKETHGKMPDWVHLAANLDDAPEADVAAIVDGIYADAGIPLPKPPPTGTYTCVGQQVKLFDNWNIAGVDNGGASPTFSTGGKTYCIDLMATYHWNGGKGSPVGTIWLTSGLGVAGPWVMSGQNPDGSPGQIAWLSTPADPAKAVVSGSVTCHDSGSATWSQNADSAHKGFCRVWAREAQKTG
jgi:hypothetical protein